MCAYVIEQTDTARACVVYAYLSMTYVGMCALYGARMHVPLYDVRMHERARAHAHTHVCVCVCMLPPPVCTQCVLWGHACQEHICWGHVSGLFERERTRKCVRSHASNKVYPSSEIFLVKARLLYRVWTRMCLSVHTHTHTHTHTHMHSHYLLFPCSHAGQG